MNSAGRAIVLLSGGLDSTTCLAVAKHQGFTHLVTLAFDYGQRHRHELAAAEKLSKTMGAADHRVVHLDLRQFGGSALTADIAVPKDRDESQMAASIPVTYVPARNTVFLSFALVLAEVTSTADVFIGVNAIDYSGYPDCRPEYIQAFERLANLATKMATTGGPQFRIHTPLIELSKSQIIRWGTELNVDYSLTHSCYDPDDSGRACGRCDSCVLRRRGFTEAGVKDPTHYAV
jgi:7-cyano-7-deazaguanine synthase